MPEMDAAADEELRELRARAYGPHADIATDPAAVRRLEELESSRSAAAVRRGGRDHAVIADSGADGEPAELRVVHPSADAARESSDLLDRLGDEATWEEPIARDAPTDAPPQAGRLTRWRTPLWAASVVMAAALAAMITYAFASIPPVSSAAGAPQIATLELTRTGAVPPGWFGAEEDVAAVEFYGLTIFATPGWVLGVGGSVVRESLPQWRPDGGRAAGGGPRRIVVCQRADLGGVQRRIVPGDLRDADRRRCSRRADRPLPRGRRIAVRSRRRPRRGLPRQRLGLTPPHLLTPALSDLAWQACAATSFR
ncbi:hypothetical protein QE375_002762 [Microbacterium foliorum]|uniref:Uncharacterized protein n=1 Tax=Microbacterium foliorum TaxID=104336 RepID=A0ABU1HT49_9MICO|nr:hypothetical protein [Microbacterium foliorum]MDR6143208.1 hypothetical protein [Microbacterium foliorum]